MPDYFNLIKIDRTNLRQEPILSGDPEIDTVMLEAWKEKDYKTVWILQSLMKQISDNRKGLNDLYFS